MSLQQILTRMAKQVDMRWETDGQTITVMPDSPYLRSYRVDYVNMARDVSETVGIATQIIGGTVGGAGAAGGGANNSTLTMTSTSRGTTASIARANGVPSLAKISPGVTRLMIARSLPKSLDRSE